MRPILFTLGVALAFLIGVGTSYRLGQESIIMHPGNIVNAEAPPPVPQIEPWQFTGEHEVTVYRYKTFIMHDIHFQYLGSGVLDVGPNCKELRP